MSQLTATGINHASCTAYGYQTRKVKIKQALYKWDFILAKVTRPILGIDFLKHFGMSIDFANCMLLHTGQRTKFTEMTSNMPHNVLVVLKDPLKEIKQVLQGFPEVTDQASAAITTKHGVECFIQTQGPPIKTPPRRLTPEKAELVKQYFDEMVKARICRRSNSQWSSALHLVPKKDGSWRPCGDYRRLNSKTIRDNYPLPHLHDFIAKLHGCKIFGKLDLVKGYHQIPVAEEEIGKTTIASP